MIELLMKYHLAVNNPELDARSKQILFEMLVKTRDWLHSVIVDIEKIDPAELKGTSFESDLKKVEAALSLPWVI